MVPKVESQCELGDFSEKQNLVSRDWDAFNAQRCVSSQASQPGAHGILGFLSAAGKTNRSGRHVGQNAERRIVHSVRRRPSSRKKSPPGCRRTSCRLQPPGPHTQLPAVNPSAQTGLPPSGQSFPATPPENCASSREASVAAVHLCSLSLHGNVHLPTTNPSPAS